MSRINHWLIFAVGPIILTTAFSAEHPSPAKKVNALVAGKIVSVEPMPENLDKWILDDLRVWRRYKLSGESEGASLVMQAQVPEIPTEVDVRGGIPQPRRRTPRVRLPGT